MPQEFQVLQCYSCKTFQVHQVKKAKKWACKMCGEKQSILKVYGVGTGAECRQHVQTLNTHRGEIEGLKETIQSTESSDDPGDRAEWNRDDSTDDVQGSGNKWVHFVEETSSQANRTLDSDDDYEDARFTTDASLIDKRRTFGKRKLKNNGAMAKKTKSSRFEDYTEREESEPEHHQHNQYGQNTTYGHNNQHRHLDKYGHNVPYGHKNQHGHTNKYGHTNIFGHNKSKPNKFEDFIESCDQQENEEDNCETLTHVQRCSNRNDETDYGDINFTLKTQGISNFPGKEESVPSAVNGLRAANDNTYCDDYHDYNFDNKKQLNSSSVKDICQKSTGEQSMNRNLNSNIANQSSGYNSSNYTSVNEISSQESYGDDNTTQIDTRPYCKSSSQESCEDDNTTQIDTRPYCKSSSQESCDGENTIQIDTRPYCEIDPEDVECNRILEKTEELNSSSKLKQNPTFESSSKWGMFLNVKTPPTMSDSKATHTSQFEKDTVKKNQTATSNVDVNKTMYSTTQRNATNQHDCLSMESQSVSTNSVTGSVDMAIKSLTKDKSLRSDKKCVDSNDQEVLSEHKSSYIFHSNYHSNVITNNKTMNPVDHTNVSLFNTGEITDEDLEL